MLGKKKKKKIIITDDELDVSRETVDSDNLATLTPSKKKKHKFWERKNKKIKVDDNEDEVLNGSDLNEFEDSEDDLGEKEIGEQVLGGRLGDVDPRTKRSQRWNKIYTGLITAAVIGAVATIYGHHEYHQYSISNSTKAGTSLTFAQTQASLELKGVYTDKNRDVTIVEFGYDSNAHSKLSSKGINYGINFVVDNESDIPSNLESRFGILGTDGNAYLILKGKLKEEAYQVYILNRFSFSTGSGTTSSSKQLDLEKKSVASLIADADFDDADSNGIFSMFTSTSKGEDAVNFRINPYSDNTTVYDTSFLTDDGDIDYNKIVQKIGVDNLKKELKNQIKVAKENMEEYSNAIDEYTDRVLANPDDSNAATELDTATKNYQEQEQLVDEYNSQLDTLKSLTFSEDSFTDINKEYNVIVN